MFRTAGRLRPAIRRCGDAGDLLMTSSRTRPSLGPAAWLSALVIGVLLALAIPALAAGAEPTEGSTAVADPPAAQTQEPAETTGSTEPPAPEQTAAPADEPAPVDHRARTAAGVPSPLPSWLRPRPPRHPRRHRRSRPRRLSPSRPPPPSPRHRLRVVPRRSRLAPPLVDGAAAAGHPDHSAAGRAAAGRRSAPAGADTHASDDPRRAA